MNDSLFLCILIKMGKTLKKHRKRNMELTSFRKKNCCWGWVGLNCCWFSLFYRLPAGRMVNQCCNCVFGVTHVFYKIEPRIFKNLGFVWRKYWIIKLRASSFIADCYKIFAFRTLKPSSLSSLVWSHHALQIDTLWSENFHDRWFDPCCLNPIFNYGKKFVHSTTPHRHFPYVFCCLKTTKECLVPDFIFYSSNWILFAVKGKWKNKIYQKRWNLSYLLKNHFLKKLEVGKFALECLSDDTFSQVFLFYINCNASVCKKKQIVIFFVEKLFQILQPKVTIYFFKKWLLCPEDWSKNTQKTIKSNKNNRWKTGLFQNCESW